MHAFHTSTSTNPPTHTDSETIGNRDTAETAGNRDPAQTAPATQTAPTRAGSIEDRLTDAVLRHALTNPERIEYNPNPDPKTSEKGTPAAEPGAPADTNGADANPDADSSDDPPPF